MSAAANEILMLNFLVEDKTPKAVSLDQILPRALRALRTHLGMDIAFISEFRDGRRLFRYVDAARDNPDVQIGGSDLLEDSYCQRVVDGRLPELIPDAAEVSAANELAFTPAGAGRLTYACRSVSMTAPFTARSPASAPFPTGRLDRAT